MSDIKVAWRISTSYFLNVRHRPGAAHGRGKRLGLFWITLTMLFFATGCEKPDYRSQVTPSVYPTISSDGKMVVIIDNQGENHPRLTIYRLDNGTVKAETVNAPPWTYGIRFGLQGHNLLVTHFITDRHVSDLLKWNLDKLLEPPEHIFRALRVEYPLEISPGIYLIKANKPSEKDPGTSDIYSGYRSLISRKEIIKPELRFPPGTRPSRTSAWPNYVEGKGFFWMYGDKPKEPPFFPKIAYPDGDGPDLTYLESVFDENTTKIRCDYHARRCLRKFIAGKDRNGKYDYDLEVLYDKQRCPIDAPELVGDWPDIYELTPDGNAAVVTVADKSTSPLRGVVMRFEEGQCSPVSVRTLFDRREKP